jgi:cullin-4
MRMESMLKDWYLSDELFKAFKSGYQNRYLPATTISVVSILWPQTLQPDVTMKIPSGMREIESAFSSFYLDHKKGAKLTWNRRMGSCVMNAYFGGSSQPKELVLTMPQALLLLQFNSHDSHRFSRLLSSLEMSPALLEETVASLTTAKYPILIRKDDELVYNAGFACEARKVPFYLLQSPFLNVEDVVAGDPESGLPTSTTSTPELVAAQVHVRSVSVIVERQLQVDCMLVRRMKSVAKCPRSDLINFVLASLKEMPISAADVDGRIDGLVDKEFLKLVDAFTIAYVP